MDKVLHSSESVEWGTPPDLYAKLNKRYCFDYDPASTHENHLTYRYSTLEGTFDDHNGHLLKLGDEDGLEWEWDDNQCRAIECFRKWRSLHPCGKVDGNMDYRGLRNHNQTPVLN